MECFYKVSPSRVLCCISVVLTTFFSGPNFAFIYPKSSPLVYNFASYSHWINIQMLFPLPKTLLNLPRVFRTKKKPPKKFYCIIFNLYNFTNQNNFVLIHNVIPEGRNLALPFITCNISLSTTKFTHFPLSARFRTKERLPLLIWLLSVSFTGVFQYLLLETCLAFTLSPSTDLFCHPFWNIYSLKILSQSSLFL